MKKFEYDVFRFTSSERDERFRLKALTSHLNVIGEKGWELVSMTPSEAQDLMTQEHYFVYELAFKREIGLR